MSGGDGFWNADEFVMNNTSTGDIYAIVQMGGIVIDTNHNTTSAITYSLRATSTDEVYFNRQKTISANGKCKKFIYINGDKTMTDVAKALTSLGITEWVLRGEPTNEEEFNQMFRKVTGADKNGSAIESADPKDWGVTYAQVAGEKTLCKAVSRCDCFV